MDASRRAALSEIASGIARQLMVAVPACDESAFVAGRVFATMVANGIDLKDAQAKGLSIEDMIAGGAMAECVTDMRGILEMRLVLEHPATGVQH